MVSKIPLSPTALSSTNSQYNLYATILANDGTKDNTTAILEQNYIYPRDLANYSLAAA
jgi:hypothetical protein